MAVRARDGLEAGNIRDLSWDRVDMDRRIATIGHGDTKNGDALGVPLNDLALAVLTRQQGKHKTRVFTYAGRPICQVNTQAWKKALIRCGIKNFRWHDLCHSWATWLRQKDVPTWVLQELGGWKSESMVRRYAHSSVKHLQPYAEQLIFQAQPRTLKIGRKRRMVKMGLYPLLDTARVVRGCFW
nr:site-specific integrase [Sphingobium boeckii]